MSQSPGDAPAAHRDLLDAVRGGSEKHAETCMVMQGATAVVERRRD